MSDGESRRAAREASVCDQGALLAQVHGLDVGGRVEHLLHAWASLRSFIGDDDHVARYHLAAEDALAGVFLGLEDLRRTAEFPDALVHTGCLDHASVQGDIAFEHAQSTVFGVGVVEVTDAPVGAVRVQSVEIALLGAHHEVELTGWCALIFVDCLICDIR